MAFLNILTPAPSVGKGFPARMRISFLSSQPFSLVNELKRSGWGMRPKMRPVGSQMPAMSSSAPLGFSGKWPFAGEPSSFTYLKAIWSSVFIFSRISGVT